MIRKLICICLIIISVNCFAQEPLNLAHAKQRIAQYYTSGEYFRDIKATINNAISFLKHNLPHLKSQHKRPAIVLDIDETALSNYPIMDKMNFGMVIEELLRYMKKAEAPVIPATLELYNFAKANGIAVIFITGRSEWQRQATIKNLTLAGYKDWDGLYMKPDKDAKKPDSVVKKAIRKQLIAQGYRIVANIGDQESDFSGGFADRAYKLPNPFYLIQDNLTEKLKQ